MNQYQSHCPICQYQFNGDEDDPGKPTRCPNSRQTLLVEGPRTWTPAPTTARDLHTVVSRALGEDPALDNLGLGLPGPVAILVRKPNDGTPCSSS